MVIIALVAARNLPGVLEITLLKRLPLDAGARYALNSDAASLGIDTTEVFSPVEAVIFAQAGFIAGATLEGTKYTRIIP